MPTASNDQAAPAKEPTIMTNFRWTKSVRSRLARIVKEKRSQEPDKKKKSKINRTTALAQIVMDHPVNWKA
jgi:hypothetical protein